MAIIKKQIYSRLIMFALALLTTACASSPDGGPNRYSSAARSAFTDNGTWPLLVAAAALRAGDYDARLTEYAMETGKPFPSDSNVANITDQLREYIYVFPYGTALAIDEGWGDKATRLTVDSVAFLATRQVTNQMNARVSEEYPNGNGYDSFGSHHAASPFAAAALTRRNLAEMDLPGWANVTINTTAYVMAAGSSWGRVVMGLHYPSDQLASAAAGNFVALFFHDAFLRDSPVTGVSFLPEQRYVGLQIAF